MPTAEPKQDTSELSVSWGGVGGGGNWSLVGMPIILALRQRGRESWLQGQASIRYVSENNKEK